MTMKESLGAEPNGRTLKCLFFKFGSRTITLENVDLSTTFGKLRERVIAEKNLKGLNIYFVFRTKKLDDGKSLRTPPGLV